MKKSILAIATALLSGAFILNAQAELSTGVAAPDFTLLDSNGTEHSLSGYKGKHVVLEWTNYQCPFVVKHYKGENMQSLQKEFTGKDVIWLSICSSAAGKQGHKTADEWNQQIKDADAAPSALLIDESGEVGKLYNAKTTPHMFIINPEGTLVYQGAIDSIKSFNAKDIPNSENYVKSALNALLSSGEIATPKHPLTAVV